MAKPKFIKNADDEYRLADDEDFCPVATGYPAFPNGEYVGALGQLQDWNGQTIGTAKIVARWKTPRSWISSHLCQIECIVKGHRFTGRGCGHGMAWRGRLKRT